MFIITINDSNLYKASPGPVAASTQEAISKVSQLLAAWTSGASFEVRSADGTLVHYADTTGYRWSA